MAVQENIEAYNTSLEEGRDGNIRSNSRINVNDLDNVLVESSVDESLHPESPQQVSNSFLNMIVPNSIEGCDASVNISIEEDHPNREGSASIMQNKNIANDMRLLGKFWDEERNEDLEGSVVNENTSVQDDGFTLAMSKS